MKVYFHTYLIEIFSRKRMKQFFATASISFPTLLMFIPLKSNIHELFCFVFTKYGKNIISDLYSAKVNEKISQRIYTRRNLNQCNFFQYMVL